MSASKHNPAELLAEIRRLEAKNEALAFNAKDPGETIRPPTTSSIQRRLKGCSTFPHERQSLLPLFPNQVSQRRRLNPYSRELADWQRFRMVRAYPKGLSR